MNKLKISLLLNLIMIIILIVLMFYINLPYNFFNSHYNLAIAFNKNYIPSQNQCNEIFDDSYIGRTSNEVKQYLLTHTICLNEGNNYSYDGPINDDLFVMTDSAGDYNFKVTTPYPTEDYGFNINYKGVEGYNFEVYPQREYFKSPSLQMMEVLDSNNIDVPYFYVNGEDKDHIEVSQYLEDYSKYIYMLGYSGRDNVNAEGPTNYPERDASSKFIKDKYYSSTIKIEKLD